MSQRAWHHRSSLWQVRRIGTLARPQLSERREAHTVTASELPQVPPGTMGPPAFRSLPELEHTPSTAQRRLGKRTRGRMRQNGVRVLRAPGVRGGIGVGSQQRAAAGSVSAWDVGTHQTHHRHTRQSAPADPTWPVLQGVGGWGTWQGAA